MFNYILMGALAERSKVNHDDGKLFIVIVLLG